MAKRVEKRIIGVDVAKAWLDLGSMESARVERIDNDVSSIQQWLNGLPGPVRLSVEATNDFHEALVECAHRRGHEIYLVDAYRLSRYRDAVGHRAKTDYHDARLLARYLQQEQAHLRCWTPPDPGQAALWRLLKRRATLVRTSTRLRQSLAGHRVLQAEGRALVAHCQRLIRQFDRELLLRARALGWSRQLQGSQSIPGVGVLTGIALVAAYHRGQFETVDAFIAYLGLDVRVRDSGCFRGRRKLTKKGEPELRRLLYNAAMAACRQTDWRPFYEAMLARGLSRTQALVALGRKLARVCFALLRDGTQFNPDARSGACATT